MKDLLDNQYIEDATERATKLTTNLQLKSSIYTIIMITGGEIYYYLNYPKYSTFQLVYFAVILALFCLLVSLILELVRLFFRRKKEKKTGKKIVLDPLWFLIWEGGFSIWLILFFIIIIGSLV